MRLAPTLFAAAWLALALAPARAASQPVDAATATDIRCVIIAGTMAQSDDPDMKNVGYASMLYFWGRLEGRGQTANLAARVLDEARSMTPAELKAQVPICNALVTGAGQGIQAFSNDLQKQLGGAAPK
jgi:hypothetical protein